MRQIKKQGQFPSAGELAFWLTRNALETVLGTLVLAYHPRTIDDVSARSDTPAQQQATDQEIQKWIPRQHGFVPESAWLLHCKERLAS